MSLLARERRTGKFILRLKNRQNLFDIIERSNDLRNGYLSFAK